MPLEDGLKRPCLGRRPGPQRPLKKTHEANSGLGGFKAGFLPTRSAYVRDKAVRQRPQQALVPLGHPVSPIPTSCCCPALAEDRPLSAEGLLNRGGGKRIVNCECQVLRLQHFKTGCGRTSSAGEICAAWLPHKRQSSLTVLFSHGNAVDLGAVLLFCNELSRDLQCNVLAYDYSGYGRSGGTPSVTTSLSDIRLCYDWLLEQGIPPSKIVLFGQSVGSGPTVDLAAKMPNLAGVVLHTPLLSGECQSILTWQRQLLVCAHSSARMLKRGVGSPCQSYIDIQVGQPSVG